MLVTIKVSEDNIKNGKRNDSALCPLALALVDKFGAEACPHVFDDLIYMYIGDKFYRTRSLQGGLVEFIRQFDSGWKSEPCEFVVYFYEWDNYKTFANNVPDKLKMAKAELSEAVDKKHTA